jgi:hypothetical protein
LFWAYAIIWTQLSMTGTTGLHGGAGRGALGFAFGGGVDILLGTWKEMSAEASSPVAAFSTGATSAHPTTVARTLVASKAEARVNVVFIFPSIT